MLALFVELRRRNVVRVAGLYLVSAWIITQVTDTLLPAFDLPGSILRTVVIVLAAGFLPVLALAWAFELSPNGLQRTTSDGPDSPSVPQAGRWMNRAFVVLLVLAVGYFLVDKFVLAPDRDAALIRATTKSVTAKVATEASQERRDRSIAVLPFVNMSNDKANEYFSDGISEELLNVLLRVSDLSVASRTSSFAYRHQALGAVAIARELKVGHILEGSVRKAGNRVRVTAQLIDAVNDRHLWSETYDRELTDIFAIQDEIARVIVAELSGVMAGASRQQPAALVQADTSNMEAYDLYLKAREMFVTRMDVPGSVLLFERVVAMDPNFARGWEGLAAAGVVAPGWGGTPDRDYYKLANEAAQRALQIDDSLSLPWSVQAKVAEESVRPAWGRIMALHNRAVDADPKNTTAVLWRGQTYWTLGYFGKAIEDMDRCITIDPAYANCGRWKAQSLLSVGDEAQGMALFEEGIRAGFVWNRVTSFVPPLVRRGDHLLARVLMSADTSAELSSALLKALDKPNSRNEQAAAIVKRDPNYSRRDEAMLLMYLGDFEAAADAAISNRAVDSLQMSSVLWQPGQDGWRKSAAFKRVLKASGAPQYWAKHGYPTQCRSLGEADFDCS